MNIDYTSNTFGIHELPKDEPLQFNQSLLSNNNSNHSSSTNNSILINGNSNHSEHMITMINPAINPNSLMINNSASPNIITDNQSNLRYSLNCSSYQLSNPPTFGKLKSKEERRRFLYYLLIIHHIELVLKMKTKRLMFCLEEELIGYLLMYLYLFHLFSANKYDS